jgi:hypothetical protein
MIVDSVQWGRERLDRKRLSLNPAVSPDRHRIRTEPLESQARRPLFSHARDSSVHEFKAQSGFVDPAIRWIAPNDIRQWRTVRAKHWDSLHFTRNSAGIPTAHAATLGFERQVCRSTTGRSYLVTRARASRRTIRRRS